MELYKLKQMLIDHEGERLRMYKCPAGKWTIGIGHNIEDKGISKAVSDLMFMEDIREVLTDLPRLVGEFESLPDPVQYVLADMRFQLGFAGIREFKKTLQAANARDWPAMMREMKASAWYRQTTDRAEDLIRMVRAAHKHDQSR
jgi:lysozyme